MKGSLITQREKPLTFLLQQKCKLLLGTWLADV